MSGTKELSTSAVGVVFPKTILFSSVVFFRLFKKQRRSKFGSGSMATLQDGLKPKLKVKEHFYCSKYY